MKKIALLASAFILLLAIIGNSCTKKSDTPSTATTKDSTSNDSTSNGKAVVTLDAEVQNHGDINLNASFDIRHLDGMVQSATFLVCPYELSEEDFFLNNPKFSDVNSNGGPPIRLIPAGRITHPTTAGDYTGEIVGQDYCHNGVRYSNIKYYYRVVVTMQNGEKIYGNIKTYVLPSMEGDGQAGGYIVYDKGSYSDGWRYIEMAPCDVTSLKSNYESVGIFPWDSSTSYTDVMAYSTEDGYANTQTIIANCPTCVAAHVCNEFSYGGKSDWYLPSALELQYIYQYFQKSYNTIQCKYDLNLSEGYWSSTESNKTSATATLMRNGSDKANKKGKKQVRPVRRY